MSLKIGTSKEIYNLSLRYKNKKISLKANGADIRYKLLNSKPSDYSDWVLRTDVNTETVAGLSGSTYVVTDSTIYRLNEIVTILSNAGDEKGAVKITAKGDSTHITVEKLEDSGAFTLANNDKIFIVSDEILIDGADEVILDFGTRTENTFLICSASVESADNLQITDITFKKKI